MKRRDFLKRLGLWPFVLPFLKWPESEPIETSPPPIEPNQKLDIESMFCFSNPSPYFGPGDIEAFYRALDEMRADA